MAKKTLAEFKKFKGKVKWAKVNPPGDTEYQKYSVAFYPDDVEAFRALKLKAFERKDKDDNSIFWSLGRPFTKTYDGEEKDMGMVTLFDAEGVRINEDRPQINNGSIVTVKLVIYPITKSKEFAHRLEAIMIHELAVWEKREAVDLPF